MVGRTDLTQLDPPDANAGSGSVDVKTPHVGQAVPAVEWVDEDGFQLHDAQTEFRQAQPALRSCKLTHYPNARYDRGQM